MAKFYIKQSISKKILFLYQSFILFDLGFVIVIFKHSFHHITCNLCIFDKEELLSDKDHITYL